MAQFLVVGAAAAAAAVRDEEEVEEAEEEEEEEEEEEGRKQHSTKKRNRMDENGGEWKMRRLDGRALLYPPIQAKKIKGHPSKHRQRIKESLSIF